MEDKEKTLDIHDREQMQDAFGEDITIQRRGTSDGGEYIATQRPLKPRNEYSPNDLETGDRVLKIATGQGKPVFDNPIQLAVALSEFEQWSIDKNITPSFAGLCYYLNISKPTLIKYTQDKTEYICYSIRDTVTGEYIYSTNNKHKLELYIERNSIVDMDKDTGEAKEDTDSNITVGKCKSVQRKIDNGEYEIVTATTTFASTLDPIKNLLEIVNINNAEHSRNPSWQIFLAKNSFGVTDHYADEQQIALKASNPLDDLSDEQVLKLAEGRPDDA